MDFSEQVKTINDVALLSMFMCMIEEIEQREVTLKAATLWMNDRLKAKLETRNQTKH